MHSVGHSGPHVQGWSAGVKEQRLQFEVDTLEIEVS